MHASALGLLAAAVLATGAAFLLTGCSDQRALNPDPTAPSSSTDSLGPSPAPTVSTGRLPLGLEVRYVDENGKFATVSPEDFPR